MGTKARRKFTAQFKVDVVMRLLARHKSVAQICRRNITDKLLYDWKRGIVERAPSIFEPGTAVMREAHARIADLERMVGRLTVEDDILKRLGQSRPSI